MGITNGYATLAEIKDRLTHARKYTAATIAFVDGGAGVDSITDSALGLEGFPSGARITVSGATNAGNNSTFTITTGGVAGTITVPTGSLTTEAAGATVTILDVTDPVDNDKLENIVMAASRAIDTITGTRFYTTTNDETRYYTAGGDRGDSYSFFCPDDILSITTLYTDDDEDGTYENTWTTSDWRAFPLNYSLDGLPIRWLKVKRNGSYTWPLSSEAGVKIVGKFGYCTAANQPPSIKEACLLIAAQLFTRKDMIFNTAVTTPLGTVATAIAKEDPHISMLLQGPWQRIV